MNRILILTMAVMLCIPISFNLLIFGYDKTDSSPWYLGAIVLFLTGVAAWEEAIRRARDEDRTKERQMTELINEVRRLRQDHRR